jgi:RNA polymerase sigma-70 factor (ECF subfamily)
MSEEARQKQNCDIDRLVQDYGSLMMRQAYFYLKDRQKAEDACQEVFLRIYNKQPILPDPGSEKAYLLRVTINVCKDYLKSAWNRKVSYMPENYDAPAIGGSPEGEVIDAEEKQLLLESVMELPPIYKDVVLLFYYQDMPTEQIAKILGIPGVTVRTRLMRAREKLQVIIKRRLKP